MQKELLNNPRKYLAISKHTLKASYFLAVVPRSEAVQHSCRQGEAGSCEQWGTSCTAVYLCCRAHLESIVLTALGSPHVADTLTLSRQG